MADFEARLQRYDNPRLIESALEYAALGLRVIPLDGKRPFMERWPDRATSDPAQIVKWFETWPGKNLGIVTGNGLIVVDVDPRNGGCRSFRKLTRGRGFPRTATAYTGSGGNHYLFRVDPALQIGNINGLMPGIDIKGEGGQIAVEPSIYPGTSYEYVWLWRPRQGIAEAPEWLVAILLGRRRHLPVVDTSSKPLELTRDGDEGRLLADVIDRFPIKGRGQRNDTMVKVAASLLGRGYNEALTQEVVIGWWGHFYDAGMVGTSPADAPREVGACIASILKSTKFRRAVGTDHRAAIGMIQLSQDQRAMLDWMITPGGLTSPTPHSNRVTRERRLCTTKNELFFVEALIIYFTYKVAHLAESPLKATNAQIRWPIADRHGVEWPNPTLDRESKKYVTRPGQPASHYELIVQTLKGKNGVPSEYVLTGLRQLMPSEALESLLRRSRE